MPSKAIVGEKVGMTQVWDDQNRAVAVTVVRVTPVRVVQLKTPDRDGYSAVQVTYGTRKARALNKPEAGHFAAAGDGVDPGRALVELRVTDTAEYQVGQELTVGLLNAGDKVDVTAVSKGKGFAGGMKRHNFSGQGASHGNHKHHRAPGIGGGVRHAGPGVQGHADGWSARLGAGHHPQSRGGASRRRAGSSAAEGRGSRDRAAAWCSFAMPSREASDGRIGRTPRR